MKRTLALLLAVLLCLCLAACQSEGSENSAPATDVGVSENTESLDSRQEDSSILVAYDPAQETVAQAAEILADTLSGDLWDVENDTGLQADAYEYVLLGFAADGDTLPQTIEGFLERHDFGARTIYPFAFSGEGDVLSSANLYDAISQLQPGALLGGDVLLVSSNTTEEEICAWAEGLELNREEAAPETSSANTVATAAVTPQTQQVIYLWEEGNAPAQTEYTENNGGYSDDPDFRPYLTSYPVPEGTEIKGAVLICPGGAFQFRSDQPEGVDVAEALSALGYSLWGGSAGARMAAWLGSYGPAAFGGDDLPQPGAVIMQYTGHSDYTESDPPTFACVGENDGIANWRTMERRLQAMSALGIPTEFHHYPGLGHGFGLGTGTVAEGWLDQAVTFWEEQM